MSKFTRSAELNPRRVIFKMKAGAFMKLAVAIYTTTCRWATGCRWFRNGVPNIAQAHALLAI